MITENSTVSYTENEDGSKLVNIDDYSFNLNENGDAIDSEGNVIVTNDIITQHLESNKDQSNSDDEPLTEIEIDGVNYKLDENGNAIDEQGVIILTKSEIDQELAKNNIEGVKDIITSTGIPIFDENGEPIEYEDNIEGLQAYIKDIAETSVQEGKDLALKELFERFPILSDVIPHLESNGTLDNFNKTIDYSQFQLSETDEDTNKELIIHSRLLKGDSYEEAEAYFEFIKTKKTIFETASKIQKDLIANQENERNIQNAKLAEQRELDRQEELRYEQEVNNIIDNGKLVINGQDLIIPSKFAIKENGSVSVYSREEFKTYFTTPLDVRFKDGSIRQMTGYEYDKMIEDSKRTVNHDIYDALRLFTNNDLTQIINKQVSNKQVKDIKTILGRSQSSGIVNKPDRNAGDTKVTYRLPNED